MKPAAELADDLEADARVAALAHGMSWEAVGYLAKKHPIYTTLTVLGGGAGAIAGVVGLVQQLQPKMRFRKGQRDLS